ncbi:MAG TPA: chlorite dismutase family protein [Candidatus Limnocylindria bacterium]|jgi:chlorite dismutase|nr:chlorite dismutase family protein [Candidatus Limnocylindria bacterium]
MSTPSIKLTQGIHVMHLFYRVDRSRWAQVNPTESTAAREKLAQYCQKFVGPAHPRVMSFANVGGKADLAFVLYAAELQEIGAMHRELESIFPPGTLAVVYSYLSVTELPDYVSGDEDLKRMIQHGEHKLQPGTPEFDQAFAVAKKRNEEYQFYRLYPQLDDWEIMCFYGMSKKRSGQDNWYSLDFDTRKKLMGAHAKTGRKFAGKISQLITGSTGLDDWEWGVTLMAHRLDDVKTIVYEMRFDEVSARYGDFGPFYINIRLDAAGLWDHLRL